MKIWVTTLRMLAARRLTESQLRTKLERRGFALEEIAETIERAKSQRYIDDRLFARLYVDSGSKTVGNRRIVADLVRRGIHRDIALAALETGEEQESDRLAAAYAKLRRTKSNLSMPSAARTLERKGFPASAIYQHLRAQAAQDFERDEPSSATSFEDSHE